MHANPNTMYACNMDVVEPKALDWGLKTHAQDHARCTRIKNTRVATEIFDCGRIQWERHPWRLSQIQFEDM
jgi:hypothetical protein